jgi:hypothetical protein
LRSGWFITALRTALMRGLAAAVLAAWAAWQPLAAQAQQDTVILTQDNAVIVAQQAVLSGDLSLGYAIARRLVEADPTNARALLIIAATAPSLGLASEARQAGRAAWRLTGDPILRYEIARHTAKAAMVEGRVLATQFWLRRAADMAPTPDAYDQTASDIKALRDAQRLRYAVDVSISPSDNLNNGARGGLLTIDDWFTVGPLSADAQALSGVRATAQAQLTYALGTTGRTVVGLRGYATVNRLSQAAQDSVQGLLTGSDLNVVQLEAMATQELRLPGGDWPVLVTVAAGNTWAGGQDVGQHLRVEAMTPLSRENPIRLTLSGEAQSPGSAATYALAASIDGQQDMGAGTLHWQFGLRRAQAPRVNQSFGQISSEIGYAFGKPFGPVTFAVRAGGTLRDYPEYSLVFANVTGGRQDYTTIVGVDAVFQDISLLGYVPRVSLTATATDSNISRFATQEIGVTFGIQSKF